MTRAPLTTIKQPGQKYVDEPVLAQPKVIPYLVNTALRFPHARCILGMPGVPQPAVIGYRRVNLNWVRP